MVPGAGGVIVLVIDGKEVRLHSAIPPRVGETVVVDAAAYLVVGVRHDMQVHGEEVSKTSRGAYTKQIVVTCERLGEAKRAAV